jgi:hypothetical protein
MVPTQSPIQCVPVVKRPGREADHSLPTSAEANKMCLISWAQGLYRTFYKEIVSVKFIILVTHLQLPYNNELSNENTLRELSYVVGHAQWAVFIVVYRVYSVSTYNVLVLVSEI